MPPALRPPASARSATAVAVTLVVLGLALAACFDLFHSTADLLTACELDAAAPGCASPEAAPPPEDAGADVTPTDFCSWSSDDARAHARHACAWLGACETPMGNNAFGACMFQALLAYNCDANPSHQVKDRVHAAWDCLWKVQTCRDVEDCVFPGGVETCPAAASASSCGVVPDGSTANQDVRVSCPQPGALASGENCALWEQTCAPGAGSASCAGGSQAPCRSGCSGGDPQTDLRWCTDGGDLGIDCAGNGRQTCLGFPAGADPAIWVACAAESDAGVCDPDASVTCTNGVASSCASGVPERINCAEIFGIDDGGCAAGLPERLFDWPSACLVQASTCVDSCTDAGLVGCAHGAAFSLPSCADERLRTCRSVSTDNGTAMHAACAPPP